ncbi:MAG: Crp/Fnr family transcriptional regulator [Candidatus Sumerlaeaceae bacterium]
MAELFLFRTWEPEDLAILARKGRFVRYRRGDMVFEGGTDCEHLLVLCDGQIQMFRELEDGRKVALHTVWAPALVACAALFLDQCYPASGLVVSPRAEIFEYPGDEFLQLLERRPDLGRRMISALAKRISELADRIEASQYLTANARLARWLSEQKTALQPDGKQAVVLQMTKRNLAATLGIKPETLSRAIRDLVDANIIAIRKKEFLILDPDRLIEISSATR